MNRGTRNWIAQVQYPGKKEFFVGNVTLEEGATETEARIALEKLWSELVPFPPPNIFNVIKGMYISICEEDS